MQSLFHKEQEIFLRTWKRKRKDGHFRYSFKMFLMLMGIAFVVCLYKRFIQKDLQNYELLWYFLICVAIPNLFWFINEWRFARLRSKFNK
jgi:hypothetical protein